MLISKSFLTGTLVLLSLLTFAQNEEIEVHEGWRLKKDSEGVQVYTRWIDAEDDRKARQMLAAMEIQSSIQSVIDIIKDDATAKDWVNRAKVFYHFDFSGDDVWHTYTELSIPWPFSNKDLVTRNETVYLPQENKVEIKITGVPDHIPEKKSIGRIPHFEGSWELTQIDEQTTRVEYFIFTKQEPILPRFITDPIVERGIWSTMDKMREQIYKRDRSVARANSESYQNDIKIATK